MLLSAIAAAVCLSKSFSFHAHTYCIFVLKLYTNINYVLHFLYYVPFHFNSIPMEYAVKGMEWYGRYSI